MGEQQSQKRGIRSEAQKEAGTREGYTPTPASSPVGGAFGKQKRQTSGGQQPVSGAQRKARKK
jgi:hypothetical protein